MTLIDEKNQTEDICIKALEMLNIQMFTISLKK